MCRRKSSDAAGRCLWSCFSSQGCSTSPEVELLVSRLGWVTSMGWTCRPYWFWTFTWSTGIMGWKDPFGSSQWTVRQKAYAEALKLDTMFTPQLVVQGRAHCVGNDENALIAAIKNAPRVPAPTFRPTLDSLQVSLTGCLRTKVANRGANVMVALYESRLVTDCLEGENKGRVLSTDFVVRKLRKLYTLKDMSAKKSKTISGTVNFSLWQGFNSSNCGVAVFVQNSSHQIFGSQDSVAGELTRWTHQCSLLESFFWRRH